MANVNNNVIRLSDTKTNLAASGGLINGQLGYATDTNELAFKESGGTMRYFSSGSSTGSFLSITVETITSVGDLTITPGTGQGTWDGLLWLADDDELAFGNVIGAPDVVIDWNTAPATDQFLISVAGEQELKSTAGKIKLNSVTAAYGVQLLGYDVDSAQYNPGSGGTKFLNLDQDGHIVVGGAIGSGSITGAGTPNYLSKFTASGVIGDSLLYEADGGYGIGTTTPATINGIDISSTHVAMHLNSTAKSSLLGLTGRTAKIHMIGSLSSANQKWTIMEQNLDKTNITALTDVGGTAFTFLAMDNATGHVGVGVATAAARLHSLSTTEQLRLGYDASNYVSHTVSSAGNYTIAPSGGKLGINTAPQEALHVYSDSGAYMRLEGGPNTPSGFQLYEDAAGQPYGFNIFYDGATSNKLIFQSVQTLADTSDRMILERSVGRLQMNGDIWAARDDDYMYWGAGMDCGILYNGTNMVFDSALVGSGNYIFNSGSIGVGTVSTVAQKLEVVSTSGVQARFTHTATTKVTDIGTDTNGYFNISATGNSVIIGDETPTDPIMMFNVLDSTANISGGGVKGGILLRHTNTGTSSAGTFYTGIDSLIHQNAVGGTVGGMFALAGTAQLTAGTVQNSLNALATVADLDGGTVTGDVFGNWSSVDIESAVTSIGGSVYGSYVQMLVDKVPTGSVYANYLNCGANTNYGLFITGDPEDGLEHIGLSNGTDTGQILMDEVGKILISPDGSNVTNFNEDDVYTNESGATAGAYGAYTSTIGNCTASTATIYCKRIGKTAYVYFDLSLTKNSSPDLKITFTVPWTATSTGPTEFSAMIWSIDGNAVRKIGYLELSPGTSTVDVFKDESKTAWPINVAAAAKGMFTYEVA